MNFAKFYIDEFNHVLDEFYQVLDEFLPGFG